MITCNEMSTSSCISKMLLDTASYPKARGLHIQLESGPRSAELQFGTMGVMHRRAFLPNRSSALLFPAVFSDQNVRDAGCELQGRAGVSPAPVGFADGDSDLNTKTKPFLGLNDSQVQFHSSSLSSLPSVTYTEGNEEQPRGHLTCHLKAGAGDPLVSFLDRRGGSRGRARRAGETPALRCARLGCAATKPDRGVSHSAAGPLPQFATQDSRALSHVLPLRLGTSRAPEGPRNVPLRSSGKASYRFSAGIGTRNPPSTPPGRGATRVGQFTSWEGSGAGLSPTGAWRADELPRTGTVRGSN